MLRRMGKTFLKPDQLTALLPDEAVPERVDRDRLHSAQSVFIVILVLTLVV